tara:strand:+ start:81 stop:254 length:174 start_codon:yes stop_codon:yes gene_type:complete
VKAGDIVKVKDFLNHNAYMQGLSGWIGVLIKKEVDGRCTILTKGKTWHVWHSDLELI